MKLWRIHAACPEIRLSNQCHQLGSQNWHTITPFSFGEKFIPINGNGSGSIIKTALNFAEFPELKKHLGGISICDCHLNANLSLAAHF